MNVQGPWIHLRGGMGTALCKLPAKQEHLTDSWGEVTCKHCASAFRNRMTKA